MDNEAKVLKVLEQLEQIDFSEVQLSDEGKRKMVAKLEEAHKATLFFNTGMGVSDVK